MYKSILSLGLLLSLSITCTAQQDSSRYTFKEGSYDGIGKWYLGREIAHVMGYQGMSWLERDSREKEENTSRLIKNMDIQPEDVIADIGAGSGYHVFKMAPIASKGKIYAVDIQEEMLAAIRKKNEEKGIDNIELVKGSEKSVNLAAHSVDKVLMVDVYHEFNFPYEMIQSIKSALKPNGEIFLIEYRAEDKSVPIKPLHKMSETQAVKEMQAAGFKLKENISNLPWQHCMVFVIE
ncbi:class I SAM-dependent methyltransferase [Marivirga atlantica]|uniref:Class I SAM-dependent methyltransferase n=1 Tax=Marivirga atlantica TaxID=1548457 RepID=A0A937DJR7_9BACT|nr:class I SAM-dependent methyltransferase [Marivirga atlantica]MBL0766265.1 class I SAM-dependent methyltransferase [Marivirga atlantica]